MKNIVDMIKDLHAERDRIDAAIQALEAVNGGTGAPKVHRKAHGHRMTCENPKCGRGFIATKTTRRFCGRGCATSVRMTTIHASAAKAATLGGE